MTDQQIEINGNICALTCALEGLMGYAGLISSEDRTRLIQASELLRGLILKTEDET